MFFFKKRKKQLEVHGLIRRLVDHSTPGFHHKEQDDRNEKRVNRTLPVLVIPCDGEEPETSNVVFAVTRDLSSQGVAILSQQPIESDSVIVGFWNESRCEFIRGQVLYRQPADGGFWQFGMELTELVPRGESLPLLELSRMADRLMATGDEKMQPVQVTTR